MVIIFWVGSTTGKKNILQFFSPKSGKKLHWHCLATAVPFFNQPIRIVLLVAAQLLYPSWSALMAKRLAVMVSFNVKTQVLVVERSLAEQEVSIPANSICFSLIGFSMVGENWDPANVRYQCSRIEFIDRTEFRVMSLLEDWEFVQCLTWNLVKCELRAAKLKPPCWFD